MFYSSKLLKRPPDAEADVEAAYRLWTTQVSPMKKSKKNLSDIDLYTVLPKAKSEPIYVKAEWERELEAALKETRAWVS